MKNILNISLPKIKNESIEFQIIDLKTLFKIKTSHDIEYPHRLQFNFIMFVLDGSGEHSVDFKTYSYKKGTIFFIKKSQVHSFRLNPNLKCFIIQFTDEFINTLGQNTFNEIFDYMKYSPKMHLDNRDFEKVISTVTLLQNELKDEDSRDKEQILQSLLHALLLQLKRYRVSEEFIKTKELMLYQEFIEMLHSSHNYTKKVGEYAKSLNISSKTLNNLLKKHTGKTAKSYINNYLLLEIKRLLLNKSLTLQEIANTLKFDETTNLVKFFKKYEEITPNEFKKFNLKNK